MAFFPHDALHDGVRKCAAISGGAIGSVLRLAHIDVTRCIAAASEVC